MPDTTAARWLPAWTPLRRWVSQSMKKWRYGETGDDLGNDRTPLARGRLPEQARCRVPGAVGAIEQPAPIGREGQHQPHRPPHCTSQMADRGIDRDDQVELLDDRHRVGEISDLRAQIYQWCASP